MASSRRPESIESDPAESINGFLKDLSCQAHRVAHVSTQAKTMPEPPVNYRGDIEVSDSGGSRVRRTRKRPLDDGNETESSTSSADDDTLSNGSSSTVSSMAESIRAERRRRVSQCCAQPAPPVIAQTTATPMIPCEFSWFNGGCKAYFRATDIEGWVQHVVSQHLVSKHPECKLPRTAACWFCDEFLFQARSDDPREKLCNFSTRTRHIAQHFRGGKTIDEIRPDHHFLEHLIQNDLIARDYLVEAKKWHEAPQPRGGIKTERTRVRSDWGESIEISYGHHRGRH